MKNQNFSNHARYEPLFHFSLVPIIVICLVQSIINVFKHTNDGLFGTIIFIPIIFICFFWLAIIARVFALKAQSRAIRAEENLRYFVLTGKLLPTSLTLNQIIALRFAPDAEFIPLVDKALAESLSNKEIKMAIKEWRGDYHRV